MSPTRAVLATPSAARAWLRSLLTPGPRMVDEAECVGSVLLAILIARLLGSPHVAWAAFTGFVLIRGRVADTLARGLMRLIGTAAGAGLALAALPVALASPWAAALVAGLAGAAGLYGTLVGRRGYAWLLFGITFEIVLLGKIEHVGIDALAFARVRLVEVVAGTLACVNVSVVSALTVRRRWPGTPVGAAARLGWHAGAARHAMQAGVALALLVPLHALLGLGALEQAAVTILAVMVVPVAGLGEGGLVPVTRRLAHRTVGCLAGSALALAVLLAARGSVPLLVAGTGLGIVVGRHVENAGARFAYVGIQMTLAVIVVLVPDSYADANVAPALQRLGSILTGLALLEPVLLVWHALVPRRVGDAAQIDIERNVRSDG